jgi:hypothetical protein
VFDLLRGLIIPPPLRDAVIAVVAQRLERPASPGAIDAAALRAQLARLKDLYEFGDMLKGEYLRKREAIQRQLSQIIGHVPHLFDVGRALNLLSDMPTLLDTANDMQRRALWQQVFTAVWLDKGVVVAVQPAPAYVLLAQAVADMADDGSSPVEVVPPTCCSATASTRSA